MESLFLRITIMLLGVATICAHPSITSAASYEGYGLNTGGEGGEIYTVTTLADTGAGSFRNGVVQRNFNGANLIPRKIVFAVSGDIALNSTLEINLGFLTIDGSNAPGPGITIRKNNPSFKTFLHNVHDVIMTHVRFIGNGSDLGGDNLSLQGAQRIVIDHVSSSYADDTGISLIGGDFDITVSWCLIHNCSQAMSVNYGPNGRISIHHNVLADSTGGIVIRYENQTVDFVNNAVAHWTSLHGINIRKVEAGAGFGNGASNVNVINNALAYEGWSLTGIVYDVNAGAGDDGGPTFGQYQQGYVWTQAQGSLMGQLYVLGNLLDINNLDHYSTITAPLSIPTANRVTTNNTTELPAVILPSVGMKFRTTEELDVLNSIFPEIGGKPPIDFNADGYVDQIDVDFMRSCRTGPSVPQTNPNCATADLDHDGDVDQSDFGLLQPFIGNQDYLSMMDQPLLIVQGGNTALLVTKNTPAILQLSAAGGDISAPNLNWQIQPTPQIGSANIVSGSPAPTGTPVTLNYQPATNYIGGDLFSVQVTDGLGSTASIVVNVTVIPPAPPPPPGTLYVAMFGSDINPGTEAQPFKTLLKAANTVHAGDTVYVHGGTYTTTDYPAADSESTSVLHITTDGTASSPIRFESFPGESVTLDARGINSNALVIEADYITVAKMSFINAKRSGAKISASWQTSGSSQPTTGPPIFTGTPTGRKVTGSHIVECVAHNTSTLPTASYAGIQIQGQCDNCSIEYCASTVGAIGFSMSEKDAINTRRTWPLYKDAWPDSPLNCQIIGCVAYGHLKMDENSDGLGGRYATGCTIKDCISYGNADDDMDTVAASKCLFEGNIVFNANPNYTLDGDANGLKVGTRQGGGNIIRNNISFLNPRAGFDNDDGTNDIYHNNIAYRNGFDDPNGIQNSKKFCGFAIENDLGANSFLNNISYLNSPRDVIQYQTLQPPISDYNYYGNGIPSLNLSGVKWEGAHSQAFGANSYGLAVVGNPLFVNPPTTVADINTSGLETAVAGGIQTAVTAFLATVRGKFALQNGSPCINAGTNAAAYYAPPGTMPFNGSAPDLGAVESP